MGDHDVIQPDGWPRPPGFSQALLGSGSRVLKLSGQIGREESTGEILEGFVAQWEQALANVVAVVEAAGGQASDILSLRYYVTDVDLYLSSQPDLRQGYVRALGDHYPAMTMVEVASLMDPAILVEIEAEALL